MPETNNSDIDLPVNVNLRLTISLNGVEVFGSDGAVGARALLPATRATDAEAIPGEVYKLPTGELRLRSADGKTSTTLSGA